jgi:hypothetical protein
MTNPKAFISYSWTSAQHAEWVVQLATQLRESGVDVILDKWDLKEGHDAVAFMEKMVVDPGIQKVIVVLDREYVEKADGRKGGVGTETQIISAEVYKKTDQNKFVAVIAERDAEGKPHLPIYYRSRIYIDLSDPDSYANNFDQLLRWVYDKPLHVRPDLGKPPEFLADSAISLPTRSRARRAIELARTGGTGAAGALDEYLSVLGDELEKFRITKNGAEPFDELVIKNIAAFLPYRDEYIEVLSTVIRYWQIPDVEHRIHKFFENIATYLFTPRSMSSWSDVDFDNFYFIVHEIFLYTIAILLRQERFAAVNGLLSEGYYLGDATQNRSKPIEDFGIFHRHAKSFEIRNQRLALRRLSLRADLLEQRSQSAGLPFKFLMQADFLLFLRSSVSSLKASTQQWWPDTLLYAGRHNGPFEIFARSQSAAYFEKIMPMIGVSSKQELLEVFSKFSLEGNTPLYIPRWEMNYLELGALSGVNELASRS